MLERDVTLERLDDKVLLFVPTENRFNFSGGEPFQLLFLSQEIFAATFEQLLALSTGIVPQFVTKEGMIVPVGFQILLVLVCLVLIASVEEGDVFYFAYGSDMQYNRVAEKVGRVNVVGSAVLPNFDFRFNKFGIDGTGKANIVESVGKSVYGVIYRCTRRQLDMLDQFEGVPDHATRELVTVTVQKSGETIETTTYRASKRMTINPGLPPSTSYLSSMLDGAKTHNFPAEFGVHIQSLLNQLGYVPEDQKEKHREL